VQPGLFLFDIDGTLLKGSTAVHRDAFAHAYRAVYGLPLSLEGVAAAGRTDTWLLVQPLRSYGLDDTQIWEKMPQAFAAMEDYVEEHLGDLRDKVLPGVTEVLAGLHARGHLLGLLTGNLARIARAKMRRAGLSTFVDTGGFGEESEVRAHLVPVALAKAGELAGAPIPATRSVVIGDTPFDVQAGREHGTRTAAVATGPYTEESLREAGADLVLESLRETDGAIDALIALIQ
jgi:phosphoglycolate phosphatase-like HAD superfamily hydrolase